MASQTNQKNTLSYELLAVAIAILTAVGAGFYHAVALHKDVQGLLASNHAQVDERKAAQDTIAELRSELNNIKTKLDNQQHSFSVLEKQQLQVLEKLDRDSKTIESALLKLLEKL